MSKNKSFHWDWMVSGRGGEKPTKFTLQSNYYQLKEKPKKKTTRCTKQQTFRHSSTIDSMDFGASARPSSVYLSCWSYTLERMSHYNLRGPTKSCSQPASQPLDNQSEYNGYWISRDGQLITLRRPGDLKSVSQSLSQSAIQWWGLFGSTTTSHKSINFGKSEARSSFKLTLSIEIESEEIN